MRGSIVKRGKTYTYVLSLGRDASGRKRQKWVGGFRTKKDAEVALAKVLDRVHTGTFVDAGHLTVGDYLEQWLDGIRTSVVVGYEMQTPRWDVPRGTAAESHASRVGPHGLSPGT